MNLNNTSSLVTTDPLQIKHWVKLHNGVPALMVSPGSPPSIQGLRLDFASPDDTKYLSHARESQKTTWKKFFEYFEHLQLAFIYIPSTRRNPDMCYRFIKRENAQELSAEEKDNLNLTNQKLFPKTETTLGVFENGSVETPITPYELFQEEISEHTTPAI